MNKGFGTHFHKVYKENAKLYDVFSSAEVFSSDLSKKVASLITGKTLLDVACGTCHKTNIYSKYFDRVYALDKSKRLLDYAKSKYRYNKKLIYLHASADKIPLLNDTIDTIIVTWGSFPLANTIREMQRVLKPRGVIIRIGARTKDNFTRLFPKFDIRRITRINNIFRKFGFTIEEHIVRIKFDNISTSKNILSRITGAPKEMINAKNFEHIVSLCYYQKKHDDIQN